MKAVALTLKRSTRLGDGELMFVHVCEDCGKVSINRIAADDVNEQVLGVLRASGELEPGLRRVLAENSITPLAMADWPAVMRRLFGLN